MDGVGTCFPEQLSSHPSLVLSGVLRTLALKITWPGPSEGDTGKGCRETLSSSFLAIGMPCSRWDLSLKSGTNSVKQ